MVIFYFIIPYIQIEQIKPVGCKEICFNREMRGEMLNCKMLIECFSTYIPHSPLQQIQVNKYQVYIANVLIYTLIQVINWGSAVWYAFLSIVSCIVSCFTMIHWQKGFTTACDIRW